MSEGKPVRITVEEGNTLLMIASRFSCPDKLGETTKLSPAEQLQANLQVGKLYRELKRVSPYLKSDKRIIAFGPEDAWDIDKGENGSETYKISDPGREVEISLKRDALNGLTWALVCMIHPGSPLALRAGAQEDICWPVARKIGRERAIQAEIKLDPAAKSKWDDMKDDTDYKDEPKPAPTEEAAS